MIRVVFTDGEEVFYKSNNYNYVPGEGVFSITFGLSTLWIPIHTVKSIGRGMMVNGEFKYD